MKDKRSHAGKQTSCCARSMRCEQTVFYKNRSSRKGALLPEADAHLIPYRSAMLGHGQTFAHETE